MLLFYVKFYVVVLLWTAKKCTKNYNARADIVIVNLKAGLHYGISINISRNTQKQYVIYDERL